LELRPCLKRVDRLRIAKLRDMPSITRRSIVSSSGFAARGASDAELVDLPQNPSWALE